MIIKMCKILLLVIIAYIMAFSIFFICMNIYRFIKKICEKYKDALVKQKHIDDTIVEPTKFKNKKWNKQLGVWEIE